MADGTTIKNTFIPRIHRSNAQTVLDDAEYSIESLKRGLCVRIACTPTPDMINEIALDVEDIVEEIREHSFKAWGARMILDFPSDVVDDYDDAQEPFTNEDGSPK